MINQPFVVPALLIILVSLPLVFGLIPKNRFYGFKTPKTLSDDQVWYRSNRYGARALIFSCLAYLLVAKLVPATGNGGTDFSVWLLHFAVFALPLFTAIMLTLRYVRRL